MKNIAIFGSTGTIGQALVIEFAQRYPQATIHAVARSSSSVLSHLHNLREHQIDINDEKALKELAQSITSDHKLDCVIVAIGMLYNQEVQPEKSLRQLSAHNFETLFAVNTILPALIAKHCIPKLNKQTKSVFAVLSARVGSISDNRLGGWYAYRASKAGLNMIVKTASIETTRTHKHAVVVSLHPGTVDSHLSQPFQRNVPQGKLFTADFSAQSLVHVIDNLDSDDTGKSFAWDGQEILP